MIKINFISELIDLDFLNDYKYIEKDQFLLFVKLHIDKILEQIDFLDVDFKEYDTSNIIEKIIINALKSSAEIYYNILNKEQSDEELDIIIHELIRRKVYANSIDNIILLEEIEYLQIPNVVEKLKAVYYYLLELEIYNYFSIEKLKWKNQRQKEYYLDRMKYSSMLQSKIKQEFIQSGNTDKQDMYTYSKTIGFISTYPMREIINQYDDSVLMDVYKIKYLLTLDSKLQKCSDNKQLEMKNKALKNDHKDFFKEVIEKYKTIVEEKDITIKKLEKDNESLIGEKVTKQEEIKKYVDYIEEYNNLSWFEKIKRAFKKDSIKLK